MCQCAISNDFHVEPVVDEYQLLLDKKIPARCYFRTDGREPSRGDAMATHPQQTPALRAGPVRADGARACKDIDLVAFRPVPFPELGLKKTFNANFCRNPMCPNFGPTPDLDASAERYSVFRDADVRTDRRYKCLVCEMSSRDLLGGRVDAHVLPKLLLGRLVVVWR